MAANSLIYFAYSLMTLAANDKQATESSLKSWEPPVAQQWQYEAYPINEKLDSDEAERYHPNPREELESGGCPDNMKCIEHCQENGFQSGICDGSMECRCFRKSRGDSDEAERYHPNPRVDLDEAEQYPPPTSDEELQSYGCPNHLKCQTHCRSKGFEAGLCINQYKTQCQCYNKSRVDPDEAEQCPPPTSGEELQSGGCPDNKECFKNCQLDGYDKGYCIGPAKENCYCSKNSPVNSDEAEQYHPNPRVDSDEAEQYPPPTSDEILDLGGCRILDCTKRCKRMGYKYGLCCGPDKQTCVCYRQQ